MTSQLKKTRSISFELNKSTCNENGPVFSWRGAFLSVAIRTVDSSPCYHLCFRSSLLDTLSFVFSFFSMKLLKMKPTKMVSTISLLTHPGVVVPPPPTPTGLLSVRGWDQRLQSPVGSHHTHYRNLWANEVLQRGKPRAAEDPVCTRSLQAAEEARPVSSRQHLRPPLLVRSQHRQKRRGGESNLNANFPVSKVICLSNRHNVATEIMQNHNRRRCHAGGASMGSKFNRGVGAAAADGWSLRPGSHCTWKHSEAAVLFCVRAAMDPCQLCRKKK